MNTNLLLILFISMFVFECGKENVKPYQVKDIQKNNMIFAGYDSSITDPKQDNRCYYKIFIDKIEHGRTTIALESQKKYYETRLSSERHLLIVEKWVLDLMKNRYVKLNNIRQPRPNYFYFNLSANAIVRITMTSDTDGISVFKADYGMEIEPGQNLNMRN